MPPTATFDLRGASTLRLMRNALRVFLTPENA